MPIARASQFLEDLGPTKESAKRCVHCGFCNTVCPTSNVLSAFKESRTSRGRVVMLQSLVEGIGNLDPYDPEFKELIDLCYSCRRCVAVCPAGIPIPDLMSYARYAYRKATSQAGLTLGHRIFANYGTFDRIGSAVAPLSNLALRKRPTRALMQWVTHVDARARLPRFHSQSFETWFRKQPSKRDGKKIVYFVDSFANFNDPSLGKTLFIILSNLGYQVIVPPQKESGMPAVEYGLTDKARSLARYNVSQLYPYAKQGIPIVCSSPAATYLLREGYGRFLEDDNLQVVSNAVEDMAEFLNKEYEIGYLGFRNEPPESAVYHYCCLSQAISLGQATTKLLSAAGIRYRVVDKCCGGAGVWGAFKENYELSKEIAAKLREKVDPNERILTESETCKLQIEAHVSTNVQFPLTLLVQRMEGLKQIHN